MLGPITEQEKGMSLRIAGYTVLRESITDLILDQKSSPETWLDTGCGAGGSIRLPLEKFKDTHFTLADPSENNIAEAKRAIGRDDIEYVCSPTHQLGFEDGSFDVITAILSHHYYPDRESKKDAIKNCLRMLKEGGIYVMVEHTIYDPEDQARMDADWRLYMKNSGLDEESIQNMFERRNTFYFPLDEKQHLDMLKEIGFSETLVFWRSCSDIGICARK